MINLNVRKLDDVKGADGRGACSPARLPWAPDAQVPQDKQRNPWVWFVHTTLSQGCISHRLPVSLIRTQIQQQAGFFFPRHSKGTSLPRLARAEVWSQEGPAATQGSHPHTASTDPTSLQRAHTPGAVPLATFFCLELEALTSTETCSASDASCKVQEATTLMHNPT